MKKIYLAVCAIFSLGSLVQAQSFSDNFDSYTANAFLGTSSSSWKTWTNKPGGADDIKISNAKAHSGSNSLYFTSTSANGGPSDIVLPFGGSELTSGTFTMSMYMFVDAQKKGYFNLQEQTTLGNGWSIDVNFDSIGGFNIVNTTSGALLTGTYPQNAWFKMSLIINLSTNTWDFQINDVSKGVFQNSYRKIASMDIYPIYNSSYYVDDVTYTITPATPTTLNGSITYVDKIEGRLAGSLTTPVIEVRNLGTTVITSANIEVDYNGKVISKLATGLNIAAGALFSIPMNDVITIVSGNHALTATLKQVNGSNDDNAADNVKVLAVNPIIPAINKAVVGEEATGTWCQWCPRGAVWLKNMEEKYGEYFIGIAVHNNDPMRNSNYDGAMKNLVSGYPNMLVDRGPGTDPSAMEPDFLNRIMVAPKGVIRNGATYNSATGELKVSLTTTFKAAVTGNYKIAFVLSEDSVTGTDASYNQANAYAGGSKGVMGGFEKLPNPVPAAQMVYDHVGRIIYPNFSGLSNAYGNSVNANDSFTHNFSVVLDPSWKLNKIHIIGMLIDPSGRIDNAAKASVAQAIANGYKAGTEVLGLNQMNLQSSVRVFPNPSKNTFVFNRTEMLNQAAVLSIYSMDGKMVYSQLMDAENISVDAAAWPAGVYVANIATQTGNVQLKLVKE